MKKIGFLVLLVIAFLLPITTLAEAKPDKEFSGDEKEVKVYFFYGQGCPHCAEAEEWFKSIEKEHGKKFEVIAYECWNNPDNQALLDEIGEYRDVNKNHLTNMRFDIEGVPYITIGKSAWNGFDQSYTKNILKEIESTYKEDPEERYDIMKYVSGAEAEDTTAASIIALVILVLVVGGIGTGIYFTRKKVN